MFFIFFVIVSKSQSQTLTDSLAAYYPFSGTAEDKSGNNCHLTNVNAIDTTDRFGKSDSAYWFNGTDAYLFFSDWKKMFANNFSFSCWIFLDDWPVYGTMSLILNIGGTTKDAGIQISYGHLGQFSGVGIYCYQTINASGTYNAPRPPLNKWTHLTGTRDNDTLSFWVNGKLFNRVATKYEAELLGLNSGFYIGCKQGNSNFFKGRIDDVRIYKRVLSDVEIISLAEEKVGVDYLLKDKRNISVFPNPSYGGLLNVSSEMNIEGIEVLNSLGQVLKGYSEINSTSFEVEINKPGCYIFKIFSENSVVVRKVLVVH